MILLTQWNSSQNKRSEIEISNKNASLFVDPYNHNGYLFQNYIGDPHHKCRPECYTNSECPYNKPVCVMGGVCHNPCENACGAYANCELRQTTPVCSCPKHMTGNPLIACRVFEKRKYVELVKNDALHVLK